LIDELVCRRSWLSIASQEMAPRYIFSAFQ
jgi:hypothetical protein